MRWFGRLTQSVSFYALLMWAAAFWAGWGRWTTTPEYRFLAAMGVCNALLQVIIVHRDYRRIREEERRQHFISLNRQDEMARYAAQSNKVP